MLFITLFVLPLLASLWFLNLTTFLKKLKTGKDTRNQNIVGVVLTFIFIFVLMYSIV